MKNTFRWPFLGLVFLCFPLLASCRDQIGVQREYVSKRDKCQELAEMKIGLYADPGRPGGEKSTNSMLLALFSSCMHANDWGVTSPKKILVDGSDGGIAAAAAAQHPDQGPRTPPSLSSATQSAPMAGIGVGPGFSSPSVSQSPDIIYRGAPSAASQNYAPAPQPYYPAAPAAAPSAPAPVTTAPLPETYRSPAIGSTPVPPPPMDQRSENMMLPPVPVVVEDSRQENISSQPATAPMPPPDDTIPPPVRRDARRQPAHQAELVEEVEDAKRAAPPIAPVVQQPVEPPPGVITQSAPVKPKAAAQSQEDQNGSGPRTYKLVPFQGETDPTGALEQQLLK